MTIEVGAAAATLIMPTAFASEDAPTIRIAAGTKQIASAAAFWTEIGTSHTTLGYETVALTPAIDTTEQTIVDISGTAGVLTSIMSSSTNVSPTTFTIRVTIDGGTVKTFTGTVASVARRLMVGDWVGAGATATNTHGVGLGGFYDDHSLTSELYLPTPIGSIMSGRRIGMSFATSLKVTQQVSEVPFASGNAEKCLVSYSLLTQEGY